MSSDGDLSPKIIESITTAFNLGLEDLVMSTHGIMPDEAIVLNMITVLFAARKKCGFNEEKTRKTIMEAVEQNMLWAEGFGRKSK